MKKPFVTLEQAKKIIETYPTPFHIYDEKGIRENARKVNAAFSWNKGFREYFAVKATPTPAILQILKEEGCGADCSSYTELLLADAVGQKGEDIMFSSNVTPAEDFIKAAELGAIINFDDITHIPFFEKLAKIPETVSCRYNPGGVFQVSNSIMDNPGAENMYFEEKGAYTGEISPNMLNDAGVKYVIIGHSERREYFAETNETVNKKVLKAFEHGITPIMCCGETLDQREQGVTMDFIRQQVKVGFQGVTADQAKTAVIAYEPIWAIGTGKTATTEQAEEVCAGIRACIAEVYDEATAEAIRIQYGGSVNAATAPELFAQADIDGGLVGGASLKADFGKIVNYK